MKLLPAFFLLFLLIPIAQASETYTVSPTGASDQNIINAAINKSSPGDTIYLTSGIYPVDGPIYLKRQMKLTGDSDAVILVSKDITSPWFSPLIGVINCFDPFDIEISGFTIDGNCQNLNSDWANSNPSHAHDQLQLIKIIGTSNNFGQNVKIHDMTLCNSFGDGIQARLIDGIICEDNKIINCQHDSIFYKACKNCKMLNNRMAVITSDGGRFDNCFNGESEGNLVWKYDGSNNNKAFKGGANGFQVGDGGQSMGYDGRTNIIHTENIEIHNNTIVDPGRKSIVVDAAGQAPSDNVYIHDNIFVDTNEVKKMGIPVSDDISFDNPPSVEESDRVFSSIFDILSKEVPNTEHINTAKKLEQTHNEAMKQDQKINPLIYVLIGVVGIFILGSYTIIEKVILRN
jgi:hypothetical protein